MTLSTVKPSRRMRSVREEWATRSGYMSFLLDFNYLDMSVIREAAVEMGFDSFLDLPKLKTVSPLADGKPCVYVIRASNGLFKIGSTQCVSRRLAALRTATPLVLELVCVIPTREHFHTSVERTLHKLLASKRRQGEWFALDAADLVAISALTKTSI